MTGVDIFMDQNDPLRRRADANLKTRRRSTVTVAMKQRRVGKKCKGLFEADISEIIE